ncbi:hypothetical protein GJAV_G00197450 [Gymnothorax javanicus]|nr:hypothetical protein GJAV_G00197450 [Gymnothorax javanicus]
MSLPEPAPRSQVPLPSKTGPKPPIPSKPSQNGSESPALPKKKSSETESLGKVKTIVSKFTEQDGRAGERDADRVRLKRGPRRAPTVKPKPQRVPKMGDQAPPLPKKMSRRVKIKEADQEVPGLGGTITIFVREEDGRSAPDGKEVEGEEQLDGGVETEAELDSEMDSSLQCEKDCSCLCHLERPGMKLVWVPIEAEEEEDEDEEEEAEGERETVQSEVEGESGTGEAMEDEEEEEEEEKEENGSSGVEDGEGPLLGRAERAKFLELLDVKMSEQTRRKSLESDVVPQIVLTSGTPPVGLSRAFAEEEEEEDVYEATLLGVEPLRARTYSAPEIKPLPSICLPKPIRRTRLSCPGKGGVDSDSEPEPPPSQGTEDVPPAVPARVPITPRHVGTALGVPLPQPSQKDWHALRRSPPLKHAVDSSQLSSPRLPPRLPQRATSPLIPRRPPPQPPESGRRLSNLSLQPNQLPSDVADDGGREDAMDKMQGPSRLSHGVPVDLKTQLQYEPLYQKYRDTVIHKEIRRQTVSRNVSKASADYQMDWGARRGADPESRARSRSSAAESTLWQEMPSVRDSGIVETLGRMQLQRQESMFEVLTSEASYLRSLRVLIDNFMESRELQDTLIVREKTTLFSNILRVCEVSERFLNDLEERIEKSVLIPDVCDIIYYHAQHNFPAYIDYVRNQIYQEKTYTDLMQKNVPFASVIARLQESPQCQRLPFMSFLLLPFQRITRIKMLIENILKRTEEGTKEEETASKALAAVSKIIEECNTEVGKMRQMEELISIAKTLEFDKLKAIPIISQTRFLEKRGEFQEMAKGATLFGIRPKFTPVFLFLFNDLLILSSKKSSEKYVVIDHAHRSLVQVKIFDEASAGPGFDNCFCLIMLENHQGRINERILKAQTQSDMQRWMAAFPDPEDPDRDEEEHVYEDWDCPQVQCVEPYIAQQADELTLEPTEIFNVIRKGNEGWYQGIRLSDGQKGWFPAGNVLEITNEHVRRRNIRERYRVMQAASALTYQGPSKSRSVT